VIEAPDPEAINSFENQAEIRVLGRLAAGRTVLEVGTFNGFSAVLMARAGAVCVHAVDWHRGGGELGERNTLARCWANLERFGVRDQVVLHVGRSEVVLPLLRPHSFDLAFIDGGHERAPQDTELVLPLMRRGGLIAWHDKDGWEVPRAIATAAHALGVTPTYPGGSIAVVRMLG